MTFSDIFASKTTKTRSYNSNRRIEAVHEKSINLNNISLADDDMIAGSSTLSTNSDTFKKDPLESSLSSLPVVTHNIDEDKTALYSDKLKLSEKMGSDKNKSDVTITSETKENISVKKNIDLSKINMKPLGAALRDEAAIDNQQTVPKVYRCPFCSKEYKGKIIDHLSRVHKNEPVVKQIESLPPSRRKKGKHLTADEKKRQDLIAGLRNAGAFKKNCRATKASEVQLRRNIRKNALPVTLGDDRTCAFCYGLYKKRSIHKHLKRCKGDVMLNRDIRALNNLAIGDIHHEANIFLRIVASRLRKDEVSLVARYDHLIILY